MEESVEQPAADVEMEQDPPANVAEEPASPVEEEPEVPAASESELKEEEVVASEEPSGDPEVENVDSKEFETAKDEPVEQ